MANANAPSPRLELRDRVLRFLWRRIHRLCIFLVWYVLSIGPLFWHWHQAHESGERTWIGAFYFPLVAVCEASPFARYVVNAYIDLWIL